MSTTQRAIAEHLGLSISTISLALRNAPHISEQTRLLVQQTAEKLGYQLPQVTLGSEMKQITFVTEFSVSNPFISGILVGAEHACRSNNLLLHYSHLDPSSDQNISQLSKADAFLLAGRIRPEVVDQLLELDIPLVLVEENIPGLPVDRIIVENMYSMERVVTQLTDWGHQNIMFVNGPLNTVSFRERWHAYYMNMVELGLQPVSLNCPSADSATSEQVIFQWLNSGDAKDVTAIVCCNDEVAVGALYALQKYGLRVPDDVSVVGFDDVEIASKVRPTLSTCHVPRALLGTLGIQRLIERIANPSLLKVTTVVDTEFVLRDSVRSLR